MPKLPPLLRVRENLEARREKARRKQEEVRKKRERERRRAVITLGAVLVLLVPVLIVGIISERREAASGAAASGSAVASSAPASTSSEPAPAPEPSAAEDDTADDEPIEYDETHLQFGQTARYIHGYGRSYPDVPLELTVSAPTPFTPSRRAELTDAYAYPYGGEGKRQPANVYFKVTIKNLSSKESYEFSVRADVTETGDDKVLSYIEDGDIASVADLGRYGDLGPGKSVSIKDGWSLKSADKIRYELRIDGVGGQSFYFTR